MTMESTSNDPNVSDEITFDQMLHEMEEVLEIQSVPGTEIMVDAGNLRSPMSTADRVLVPQPSSDPHDPLV